MEILQLKNIVKSYDVKKGRTVEALKGVSFEFPESGFVFIVGKSGSGKSTMLNVLGLLDTYDTGEYLINGKCSKDLTENEKDSFRAQSIGFVFQEFHIIEKYTIGQNISLPLEIQQSEKNIEQVKNVLKVVGLEGYENRMPTSLSGGQKQRVAIARAIIKNPQIILADEPTGSLDSVTGSEIFNILQSLGKEKLVIVISHDLESAHKYADKIIELKDGRIDSIYEGDGGAEQVRMIVDKVNDDDIANINTLLSSGKKVVISKTKVKKQAGKPRQVQPQPELKKVKLPFKSSLKLSFYSVRSKWVRTFFTILIAMFAVAFFGFADVVSRFSADKLILQELNREDLGYTIVGTERIEDYGIFKDYNTYIFDEIANNEFEKLNLEAYPVRDFLAHPQIIDRNEYVSFIPDRGQWAQFYRSYCDTYTECNDIENLGLDLIAGHKPNDIYDVIITTYSLKCIEVFEYTEDEMAGFASEKDFFDSEIYGRKIFSDYTEISKRIVFNIVGLVDVDYSRYQELASITTKGLTLTKEQEKLVEQMGHDVRSKYNTVYVKEGFGEVLDREIATRKLKAPTYTYNENTVKIDWNACLAISEDLFNPEFNTVFKDGIDSIEDVGDDTIVLNRATANELFPELKAYPSLSEFPGLNQILGQKINLSSGILHIGIGDFGRPPEETFERDFEIIGIIDIENGTSYLSENIKDELTCTCVCVYKVPTFTSSARKAVIEKLADCGEFTTEHESARFAVVATNYIEIRQIETYFALFVNVFSILAIVLCVFAMILTYTFISQSIMLRKKDIGILRSLGARKSDVAGIFIIEGIFIALLEFLLGAITCLVGYKFLNSYLISSMGDIAERYTIVSFGLRQILLMAFATVVAVSISIVLPIIRITKKEPVDAIRN